MKKRDCVVVDRLHGCTVKEVYNTLIASKAMWPNMRDWDICGEDEIDISTLRGRKCYGGLDSSSTTGISSFALVFPPRFENELYISLLFFWVPGEDLSYRSYLARISHTKWAEDGFVKTNTGNVINYRAIKDDIGMLVELFDILEIAFDRWGSAKLIQSLEEVGFSSDGDACGRKLIPFGHGYASMSAPTKELNNLVLAHKIHYGGNPVLRWMASNVVVRKDPIGNIKPEKGEGLGEIGGIVALIMALDRVLRYVEKTTK